ncbi:transcriptional regulator GutM [Brevibacillus choshinensis]|uniref:transcriptional regulator GutM n=1 Tax=Brevibacillus choshinensis TaxID=54911 RepID=UPI002E1A884E|nr:transcriptional regulator GutM [Brevibacillus choshinensis]MED4779835.1 transcriptional regulator GutM [Brevibacillus choshinensis]
MASWGYVVLLFAGLWVLQVVFTQLQSRHYYQKLREMQRQPNGYLGVGVNKRRFGVGAVIILVTNVQGNVTQCARMSGISVFSRFRPYDEPIGKTIDSLYESASQHQKHPVQTALRMAIDQIRAAQAKQHQNDQEQIG